MPTEEHTPFVRVVDALQGDVLLVFEQAVESGMVTVESKLGEDEFDIGTDEGAIACSSMSAGRKLSEPSR